MISETILTGWTVVRWMRLGLAVLLLWGAADKHDLVPGLLGGLLLYQAVFNAGCCGMSTCATPPQKTARPLSPDLSVEFEDVKPPQPQSRT